MNTISLLRSGFANCVFVNKTPKAIKELVMRVINDPKVTLFPKKPNNIEIEPINDMTDKVTLSFDDEEVTSVWTWRKSEDGSRFVISSIE
jgi:hypothetical protein